MLNSDRFESNKINSFFQNRAMDPRQKQIIIQARAFLCPEFENKTTYMADNSGTGPLIPVYFALLSFLLNLPPTLIIYIPEEGRSHRKQGVRSLSFCHGGNCTHGDDGSYI
tara:strand:- start:127 stop:459 length:333 start_codon:yes stop_codon:yes gene_type:complete